MNAGPTTPAELDRRLLRALGARLARLRKERDLTQKAVGAHLGLKQDAISRYERGWSAPSLVTLLRLRQLFAVTIDYLIVGPVAGEIADTRLRKLAREADQLPLERRNLVLAAFQALVESAKREVQRAAPPGAEP